MLRRALALGRELVYRTQIASDEIKETEGAPNDSDAAIAAEQAMVRLVLEGEWLLGIEGNPDHPLLYIPKAKKSSGGTATRK
jgi:hypothetical protein